MNESEQNDDLSVLEYSKEIPIGQEDPNLLTTFLLSERLWEGVVEKKKALRKSYMASPQHNDELSYRYKLTGDVEFGVGSGTKSGAGKKRWILRESMPRVYSINATSFRFFRDDQFFMSIGFDSGFAILDAMSGRFEKVVLTIKVGDRINLRFTYPRIEIVTAIRGAKKGITMIGCTIPTVSAQIGRGSYRTLVLKQDILKGKGKSFFTMVEEQFCRTWDPLSINHPFDETERFVVANFIMDLFEGRKIR